MSSNLYHVHAPTRVSNVGESISMKPEIAVENNMKSRMLKGWDIAPKEDYLESRVPVLVNICSIDSFGSEEILARLFL